MNYKDSIAAEEYKNKTTNDLVVEIAVMQKVMLGEITEIKRHMADLQERKADKTEFSSYEVRLANVETKYATREIADANKIKIEKLLSRIDSLEQYKWKLVGIAGGVGLIIAIASQIYSYIK